MKALLTLTLTLLGIALGQAPQATQDQLEVQDNLLMQLHAVPSDAPDPGCAAATSRTEAVDAYLSPLPSELVIKRLEDLQYQNKVKSMVKAENRTAGMLQFSVSVLDHGVLVIHVNTAQRYRTPLCIERAL